METSARRKLGRGIEHVKTLRGEAGEFEDSEAYVFRTEVETRTPEYVKYRCFATQRQPVPDDWPLLAGEAIQNLRSALDHVVYASVKRPSARLQFPIFTDACEFQVFGARRIKGIPKPVRAAIERAQPYVVAPQTPARESLELLRTLSNTDKHRTLTTVASAVQHEYIGTRGDIEVFWEKFATDQPLGDGDTHISTFIARPEPGAETTIEEMNVSPGFAYHVRIEGMPLDVLVGIGRRVFEVVTECETGQLPPPDAPYPI